MGHYKMSTGFHPQQSMSKGIQSHRSMNRVRWLGEFEGMWGFLDRGEPLHGGVVEWRPRRYFCRQGTSLPSFWHADRRAQISDGENWRISAKQPADCDQLSLTSAGDSFGTSQGIVAHAQIISLCRRPSFHSRSGIDVDDHRISSVMKVCIRPNCGKTVVERSNRANYCSVTCRLMVRAAKARLRRRLSKQPFAYDLVTSDRCTFNYGPEHTDGARSVTSQSRDDDQNNIMVFQHDKDQDGNAIVWMPLSTLAEVCALRYREHRNRMATMASIVTIVS